MTQRDPAALYWYAAYTNPRAEKKALERLQKAGIDAYLPLVRTRKKWSDRMKWVDEPLIRSYVFLKVDEKDYYRAISVPGLVRYVTFEGKAAVIPERQIEYLKKMLLENVELEISNEHISPGEKVVIVAGTFMGMQGELVEYRGRKKVLVRLGNTGQNLLATINLELIEKEK